MHIAPIALLICIGIVAPLVLIFIAIAVVVTMIVLIIVIRRLAEQSHEDDEYAAKGEQGRSYKEKGDLEGDAGE